MVNRVIKWIEENKLIEKGDTVVCAISGGVDSIVLLDILNKIKNNLDIKLLAAHFNHHIRGDESDRDQEFTKEFCNKLGIKFYVGHGDVLSRAKKTGESVEEAARVLRYRFLESIEIATAHHANDNLETMLIKLIRGCGQDGLSGIPPKRGNIIRPILCLTREEIVEYAKNNGLNHVEDSTNNCDDYLRNRIRHNIIPLITAENKHVLLNAVNAAQMVRDDTKYIDKLAEEGFKSIKVKDGYNINKIREFDKPIMIRIIKDILSENEIEFSNKLISELYNQIESNRSRYSTDVNNKKTIVIDRDKLMIFDKNINNSKSDYIINIDKDGIYRLPINNGIIIACSSINRCDKIIKDPNYLMINKNSIIGTVYIRNRLDGDKIKLPGGTKSITKWLRDKGIPDYDKEKFAVVCDDMGVIAVLGIGVDMRHRVEIGDNTLVIRVK